MKWSGFVRGTARWYLRCGSQSKALPIFNVTKWSQNTYNQPMGFQKRWSSQSGVTWLWKTTDVINGYNEGNKVGTRMGWMTETFNSTQPLKLEHFQIAFQYIMRMQPNLRSVIRPRGDSAWYCQLPDAETKMDLKFLTDEGEFKEERLNLLGKGFLESDSLPWRVRVAPSEPDAPCYVEGLREKYPYQYELLFIGNHALMDAMDMYPMTHYLLLGLNSAVSGQPLSENRIGVFEDNKEFEALLNQRKKELLQDKSRFDYIKSTLQSIGDTPSILQAFPPPAVTKPETKFIERVVDPHLMERLVAKCYEERVTFNSFSVSLCNVALAELMKEAGMDRDYYKIATLVYVSTRRYKAIKTQLHGCNVIGLTYMSEVQSNARNSFWEYCKKVNDELLVYYTKDGLAIDQFITQGILEENIPQFNYSDNPRPVTHDYSNSYYGDMLKNLPVTEHVQLTNFRMSQMIQNFRNGLVQEILTFRGRTSYNFAYASNYLSEHTANMIADRIYHLFELVGK